MKKHILFSLAVIFMSVLGCTKPEEGGKDNPQPPAPPQEQITIPSTVDVTPVVPSEGGEAKITFTAAAAWTASVIGTKADSWVDVNPKSGNPGAAEIKISTTKNDTYAERNATIQISCGGKTKDIVLTQKQLDNITVTTDKVELGAEGGTFTIELKSNIDFSYEIDGDWITYVSTKAYTDKTLTFSAEPNDGVQNREGSVTVKGGKFSETVKVYQSGGEPTFSISQNIFYLGAEGGTVEVSVTSNIGYHATSNADWIHAVETKAARTESLWFTVDANTSDESRSGVIVICNDNQVCIPVTVNQAGRSGEEIFLELGVYSVEFDYQEKCSEVKVTS
ncbi:MAG: BACON domain-containing protein, partial [Bacteroidales bacterium]|nr:BACON domain-containing protein [Bacteroidales bacterium]